MKMKIKEHFTKMFISLGWFVTASIMLYGLVACLMGVMSLVTKS